MHDEESFYNIYVYQIITLCTLNILQFFCQLYLSKAVKKGPSLTIAGIAGLKGHAKGMQVAFCSQ